MGDPHFSKGMEVEVCSDDVGLRGAWFVATVIRSPSKKNKVLVEYQTLMADEEGSRPLREFVDVVNLRPIPPRELDRSFDTSDEVDAYLNDGWWEGVVITVLDNSRYSVYFRAGKEELEFAQSELRIHREWVKGSWVPPMEEEAQQSVHQLQQQAETQAINTENIQCDVKSDEVALSLVDEAADVANERKLKNLIPTSTSSKILCISLTQGQTSECSLFLGAPCEEIANNFPTTNEEAAPQNIKVPSLSNNEGSKCDLSKPVTISPTKEAALQKKKEHCQNLTDNVSSELEGLNGHLAPKGKENMFQKKDPSQNLIGVLSIPSEGLSNYLASHSGQEKIGSVMDCDRSIDETVEGFAPVSSNEGDKCDLSKPIGTSSTIKEEEEAPQKKELCQNLIDNLSRPLDEFSIHLAPKGEETPLQKNEPRHVLSSPSEGLSIHLAPNFGEERIVTVLECDKSSNQTVEDFSPLSNYEGEKHDLSKADPTTSTTRVETHPAEGLIDHHLIPKGGKAPTQENKEVSQNLTDTFSSQLAGLSNQHSPKGEEASLQKKKGLTQNLNNIISSPSEGWSDHLAPNLGQEKFGNFVGSERCGCHQTIDNISLSPLSSNERKQYDSSTTLVDCPETVQLPPHSINGPDQQQCRRVETGCSCPDMASNGRKYCEQHMLEQNVQNEQRRKRPREESRIIMEPFIPSEHHQQCRRTGKGWRCSMMASPWRRYCDRHEEEQNIRNGKRKKQRMEQNKLIVEPFLPSDNVQCRRTGKGWRCPVMASTGKRYCDKHQLEQDAHNEKRRNVARERRALAISATYENCNSDGAHLEPSEHQQCDLVDVDVKSNENDTEIVDQGDAGIADDTHLPGVGKNAVSAETVNESDMENPKVEAYFDDFWSLFIT